MRISDWSSDVCSSDLDRAALLDDVVGLGLVLGLRLGRQVFLEAWDLAIGPLAGLGVRDDLKSIVRASQFGLFDRAGPEVLTRRQDSVSGVSHAFAQIAASHHPRAYRQARVPAIFFDIGRASWRARGVQSGSISVEAE